MVKLLVVVLLVGTCLGIQNGIGLTPPMGWNSWNFFACNITEQTIKQAADALVSTGLRDAGYIYVNIDDCWAELTRDSSGRIVPHLANFPNGMKALADYVHSLGLKLGIYSDAGNKTCEGQPGSLYHEEVDAATFAEWEIDYLKYDNCFNEDLPATFRYSAMRQALDKVDRPIFYSICNWGYENTTSWAPALGNSWRTSADIKSNMLSINYNFRVNSMHPEVAGPGGWNDPDMLEVGNPGISKVQAKTHFTLWAFVKAPLLLGNDLNNISKEDMEIISNREVIAINQDPLGIQASCRVGCSWLNLIGAFEPEVWATELENGDVAFAIVNWSSLLPSWQTVDFVQHLGLSRDNTYIIRDLWQHKDLGEFRGSFKSDWIEPEGVLAYRVSKKI